MAPLNRLRYSYWKQVIGKNIRGLRVFDLGCGYGLLSETFARDGANVVGMDPSEGLIKIARERAREQGLAISYRSGYAEQLNPDEKFDVVVAADVLEHVNDLKLVITLSSAMVVKGGYYCFLTNNKTPKARSEIITLPEEVHKICRRVIMTMTSSSLPRK
jgi:2-polyprenyl-6-hydroxyphenyl methylase/3-demethylubiquinone-9 3-methyltransferase